MHMTGLYLVCMFLCYHTQNVAQWNLHVTTFNMLLKGHVYKATCNPNNPHLTSCQILCHLDIKIEQFYNI